MGGLLLYLGLIFLHEWLVLAWRKLPWTDYAAVVSILGVIASTGYFQGVMVGLLIATLLFVVNYSRVRVVTHVLSGVEQRSNVDRSPQEQSLLGEYGNRIYILRLQGFIFFGSASSLLGQIRDRLALEGPGKLEHVVLDFSRVYGLDSSAVLSIRRLRDLVVASGVNLVLCGVQPQILEQMSLSGFDTTNSPRVSVHPDRDRALEWCENLLLGSRLKDHAPAAGGSLFGFLSPNWPAGSSRPEALGPYLERMEIPHGACVLRQGEVSDALYFLEQGRLTAKLEGVNRSDMRLRTMNPGAVVGELGLYLNERRTASIFADGECVLYRMSREAIGKMQAEDPALASVFHQSMLHLVASRLVATSRTLQMVLE